MIQFFSTTASKITLAFAFTFVAFAFVLSSPANGDEFDRIDNMAQKIQKKSRLLIKETVHYRHTPQYHQLFDATNHLYDAATHVHQVAHFENNLDHLQSDLADLDRYFDQLEDLFQATEDSASRGRGQVHGNTGYARSLLRSIERSIDSMRRDVRKAQSKIVSKPRDVYYAPVKPQHHHNSHARQIHNNHRYLSQTNVRPRVVTPAIVQPRVVPQYRSAYPQQRRAGGFSLSIGGGSSRLHFNF